MNIRKVSELPDFEGKELALEIQRIGWEIVEGNFTDAGHVMLLGLVQVVAKLQAEIAELK
jgi:hypothetical protein